MKKASAVRALRIILERCKPDLVFLSETHLKKEEAESLKRKFHFDNVEVFESDGRAGRLLMMWKNCLNVTSSRVHSNYIDLRFDENSVSGWRFTGFYGEPSGERKHLSWDYLCDLKQMCDLPWLIGGDFNEILFASEKEGGNIRPQRCMQAFRDAMDDCNVEDLGYRGDIFTWRRGRIRERLDRVLGYIFWRDTASDLWTPVIFSYIVYNRFNSFSSSFARWSYFILIIFTSTYLILCVQQAGEIAKLSVSLGQSICNYVQVHVNCRKRCR